MTEQQINPADDGITHINIWTQAKTGLGKDLSNLSARSMLHPEFGKFACLEGYWYWLKTGKQHNVLRGLSGFEAKQQGKTFEVVYNDHFEREFKQGLYWRLAQHPDMSDALRRLVGYDQLDLRHYYVYGKEPGKQKVVDVGDKHRWQLDFYLWWANIPENFLLGKPVQLWGHFVEHDSDMLKRFLSNYLGASLKADTWAKHAIVGAQTTQDDLRYVQDNFQSFGETNLDAVFPDDFEPEFDTLYQEFVALQPVKKKYVVMKGEFSHDVAVIKGLLESIGYTVLSHPVSRTEPVVVGGLTDPELITALEGMDVLVITEQNMLNWEPS